MTKAGVNEIQNRAIEFCLWFAEYLNLIFVRITTCLRVLVLPQLSDYQVRVYSTYFLQFISHDLMLISCSKALSAYFHSENYMLLLSVGSVLPFVLTVFKVWSLIPCPRVVEMASNLALLFALFVLISMGLGTFEGDMWVVYIYTMMVWPWLVLASMISRQYIERQFGGNAPLSPTCDMPFLGVLGAVSYSLMLTSVKALSITESIALTCLDPILCAFWGCVMMGQQRRKMHTRYIKMYVGMIVMLALYTTGNQAIGLNKDGSAGAVTLTGDHYSFILARSLMALRSFYVKWAYSRAYRAQTPNRPPETEALFEIDSRPQVHRFSSFPKPALLNLDTIFDSGLRDMDFHGMGPLGTVDLHSLTESAYLLPVSSAWAWFVERGSISNGIISYDKYSTAAKAQSVVIPGTDEVRRDPIDVYESTSNADRNMAILLVMVFCIASVIRPYATSRSLFDRSSSMHSWKYHSMVFCVPFFFFDVLYVNEKLTNFQIVCLIILVGIVAHHRDLLWDGFKRKYMLLCTQDMFYEQPSCLRTLQRRSLLEILKGSCIDEYQILLLETSINHGANFRELVRDTSMKVWDASASTSAAWKLAISLVTKSLRKDQLKKKKVEEDNSEIRAWLGNLVDDCVDAACAIGSGSRSHLRKRHALLKYFQKRHALLQFKRLRQAKKEKLRQRHAAWSGDGPAPVSQFPRMPPPPVPSTRVGDPSASTKGDAPSVPASPTSTRSGDSPRSSVSSVWAKQAPLRGVWAEAIAFVDDSSAQRVAPGGTVVLSFGDSKRGQLGLDKVASAKHEASGVPIAVVEELRGYDPVQIEASNVGSLVLSARGHVWVFGSNRRMELGSRQEVRQIDGPQRMKSIRDHQIVQLASSKSACGQAHTLALTVKGEVLTCGSSSVGALGQGKDIIQTAPLQLRMTDDFPVRFVVAGARHSFIVLDEGRVFAFGDNSHGQLGLNKPEVKFVESPQPMDVWTRQVGPVKLVVAGDNHSLGLTKSGQLFSWGANASGQLGLHRTDDQPYPQLVRELNDGIVSIAAGSRHTLVVDQQGARVWAWGSNVQGQLGIGATSYGTDGQQMNAPTLVRSLSNKRGMEVLQVAAAGCHSLAVTRMGEVYAFGDNTYGQLGFLRESTGRARVETFDRPEAKRAAREMDLPSANSAGVGKVWTPERVVGLSSYHVRAVSTAEMHSLAIAL